MMLSEFEALTGFYPGEPLFAVITRYYLEFDEDKQTFCEAYKENKDGLAEKIAREFTQQYCTAEHAAARVKEESEKKIARLQAELDRELEWKPWEHKDNVPQVEYEALEADEITEELSDEKAADLIADEFGFDRSRIEIIHEVWREEINRHNRIRRVEKIHRKALFAAWDWNYIRFDVRANGTMSYEMHNGDLQLYVD